jgi:hypothetical protein
VLGGGFGGYYRPVWFHGHAWPSSSPNGHTVMAVSVLGTVSAVSPARVGLDLQNWASHSSSGTVALPALAV